MNHAVLALGQRVLAALIAPAAIALALTLRFGSEAETRRFVFGVTPIITIREMATASRLNGWEAITAVREVYRIHRRDDFDVVTPDLLPSFVRRLPPSIVEVLADYVTFFWALPRMDVFVTFHDGQMLARTPLRRIEFQLLRLARKKTIVLGYGADVQTLDGVVGQEFRRRLQEQYPRTPEDDERTRARVAYTTRHADLIINGVDWVDHVPRSDLEIAAPFFVDTARFRPQEARLDTDRASQSIRVGHVPNHRLLKGTDLLEQAVDELRNQNVNIELVIVEGVPNEQLPEILAGLDLFAEQFIIGWYGLAAVEAMSCGLPVLAYLRPDLVERYALTDLPIVDVSADRLVTELGRLAEDFELRKRIGRNSRSYAVERHSIEALAEILKACVARL